ncbi:MAG: long-chain-fatty-acid--CoA ligase [Rhodocyclaceae bacterium]|nr:long-chain-fatty-acid--CoA ligase [Rhodocyclaceae bacterium]
MWLHTDIKSLADISRHYARQRGEKVALVAGTEKRTFGELDCISNRVANAIIAAGVSPGGNIGFVGKNSIAYFEVLFGAWKAGCALAPFNWRLAAAELAQVIDDAQPPLIFVDGEFRQLVADAQKLCAWTFTAVEFGTASGANGQLDVWLSGASDSDPALPIPPETCAVLLYTSGTTGRPKGAQLSHGAFNYMRLSEHFDDGFSWADDDIMMLVMPNFHLVGMGLAIQGLYNGAMISILPAMEADKLIDVIERDRPTICCLVPTAIQILLSHPRATSTDFSSLRLVMYAGSPIESTLLKRAMQAMKCGFMQFYGATETWTLTLLRPQQHDLENESKLKACGTPPPLVELKIVDSNNREVPDGEVGEILARSPTLFSGYLNQPEITASVLQNGWYRSGDAGYKGDDGLYYLVDRVKDMIVTGGENVYSVEVEQALLKHPAVAQAAVIGVPDERWGEKIVAYVVPTATSSATPDDLIAHCRSLIAAYKSPKALYCVDNMPMTSTGKIMKRALRDMSPRAPTP